jgi:hypothetical protein
MEVNQVCDEPALSATWSNVASKHTCGKIKAVNCELLQARRPVPVSNRYSALAYLPDSTIREEETVPTKREMVNQHRSNYFKKSSEERGVKNSMKYRPDQRPPAEQQTPALSVPASGNDQGSDCKIDSLPSLIPTLVNGQVCFDKDDFRLCDEDKLSYIQSVVRESSWKLLLNKKKFSQA